MKKLFVVLLIVFAATAQMIPAQGPKDLEKHIRQAYQELLKETDKNKDGKIGKEEYLAIWKDKKAAETRFKTWDTDKDGFLTGEEYVKVVMDMGKKK